MPAYKASSSRAFFLELVLDLVIFLLCTIICLQVFVQAHAESSRSAAQSQLGIQAQQLAELFKAGYTDADSLAAKVMVEHGAERNGTTLTWYYDQDLQPVDSRKAYYTLTCAIDDSQTIKVAKITLSEGLLQLLEYDVSSYSLSGATSGSTSGGGGL